MRPAIRHTKTTMMRFRAPHPFHYKFGKEERATRTKHDGPRLFLSQCTVDTVYYAAAKRPMVLSSDIFPRAHSKKHKSKRYYDRGKTNRFKNWGRGGPPYYASVLIQC